jgi:hypothetical protein
VEDRYSNQQPLSEEITLAKTNKASLEAIRQKEYTTLNQPDYRADKFMVKQEDDSLPGLNHESQNTENNVIGIAADCALRDHPLALKTLEKGIIYFFYRSQVNVASTGTCGISDVARSFIVLRPSPRRLALDQQDGPHRFGERFRLMVVPKKVLPQGDRLCGKGWDNSGRTSGNIYRWAEL